MEHGSQQRRSGRFADMIKSRIVKQEPVRWRELTWFQSPDLKKLNDEELAKLRASLVKNNFVDPFTVWYEEETGTSWILDGHHRQKAMNELLEEGVEIEELLPANFIQCSGRKEAAELVILYSSIYARISRTGLLEHIEQFNLDVRELASQFDIPAVNLDAIANTTLPTAMEEDEIPEVRETTITQLGDVYELGPHRLLCGDSRSAEDCSRLMAGDVAGMVFTDPPYNLSIADYVTEPHGRGKSRVKKFGEFAVASGEMTVEEFTAFLATIFARLRENSRDGSIHYICMDWRHTGEMLAAQGDYEFKQLVVWNKSIGGMGTFYRSKHELVFVFKNGSAAHINNFELGQHGRYRTNVWDYENAGIFSTRGTATEGTMDMHPTVKPVEMVSDAIIDCSNTGDVILDLFGGSGTTLVASDRTERLARLMEIDPRYCDVIVRRWINYCREAARPCTIHRNGIAVDPAKFCEVETGIEETVREPKSDRAF